MATMKLEASKLELINEILNINSCQTLNSIKNFIREITVSLQPIDTTLMNKEDFFAQIDLAKASIERGEGTKVRDVQELHSFLEEL